MKVMRKPKIKQNSLVEAQARVGARFMVSLVLYSLTTSALTTLLIIGRSSFALVILLVLTWTAVCIGSLGSWCAHGYR